MEKPDDLARLERIFDEVCERTPSERAAYLDDACPDPGDRRRIEWMLDRFDRALEAGESAPKIIQGPSTPPEEVAGFRVVRELGRGGMGVVYLAEQSEPVRRKVALKIARTNLRGRQAIERFHVERQALARLSHPNVAQLFEAGATEDDFPYFAMEYVQGREIVEHCDSEQLDIGARLRLFVDVCSGVHHAHLNGVLHRDLKPSNLLVGEYDGRAVPKVIDFGVAKAIDASWSDGDLSRTGIVGTPAYLSPEAIDVSRSVDGRTDVYSLAVVLCELVAGTRAVAQKESPYEVVTPSTPRSASKVFAESDETTRARVARQRGLTPARLARLLEGDLGWIVARATAPAPEERYASVDALAADVQRFLDDRPVEAAPHDRIQVARKFARRHRTSLVAGALV
ncbi:MAG: serine/threonine-protein kinase, partial [Planctomycetota bacterium]